MNDDKKLPLQFIEDILTSLEENKVGKLSEYQFGIRTQTVTKTKNILKVKNHKIDTGDNLEP